MPTLSKKTRKGNSETRRPAKTQTVKPARTTAAVSKKTRRPSKPQTVKPARTTAAVSKKTSRPPKPQTALPFGIEEITPLPLRFVPGLITIGMHLSNFKDALQIILESFSDILFDDGLSDEEKTRATYQLSARFENFSNSLADDFTKHREELKAKRKQIRRALTLAGGELSPRAGGPCPCPCPQPGPLST
jgi:hypothetical protein